MENKRNVFDDIITGLQEAIEFEQGKRELRSKSIIRPSNLIFAKRDSNRLKKQKQGEKL